MIQITTHKVNESSSALQNELMNFGDHTTTLYEHKLLFESHKINISFLHNEIIISINPNEQITFVSSIINNEINNTLTQLRQSYRDNATTTIQGTTEQISSILENVTNNQ